MLKRLRDTRGQSSLPEYVVTFFIVIAVVVAMSVYIQRGLQARMHDARNYMVQSARNEISSNADFLAAAGNRVGYEYEPYYTVASSIVSRDSTVKTGLLEGGLTGIFRKTTNEQTDAQTISVQLPPVEAK